MSEQEHTSQLDIEKFRTILQSQDLSGLSEESKEMIDRFIDHAQQLTAENIRLRKALVRANAARSPRMSSKLKDALYE